MTVIGTWGRKMGGFVVHTVPGSPYARAVMMALQEKGADYRVAALTPRMLGAPEHLARQPFGKMPAFEHEDFQLYETQAILRYIDRVLPEPRMSPAGARALARMDQLMNISDFYLFRGVGNVIVFQRVVGPRVMGLVPDEAACAAAIPAGRLVFGELASLLGEQAYFGGDAVSLADMMLAGQVDMFAGIPEWEVLVAPHGNLVGWMARMRARPAMQATTWEKVVEMGKAASAWS